MQITHRIYANTPPWSFQARRNVAFVARLRRIRLPHVVLSSLALCSLRYLYRLLGSRRSQSGYWKAALLSLRGGEAALQGLDGLLAPLSFLLAESNRRTVQVLGLHGGCVALQPELVKGAVNVRERLGQFGDVEERDACRPEAITFRRVFDFGEAHFVPRDGADFVEVPSQEVVRILSLLTIFPSISSIVTFVSIIG